MEDMLLAAIYFNDLFATYDNSSNKLQTKIQIPDHIPAGVVIGRNGEQLRALSSQFKIKTWIELEDMTLNLSGSSASITRAVKEANALFLRYEGKHREDR